MSISDFAAVGGEADAEQSDTNQTEKPPSLLSDSMLLGLDSIYTLVHLTRSEALMDLLTSIQTLDMSITSKKIIVPDDPEQALLTQAIEMIVSLEKEKHIAYRFVCAHYEGRFPELESFLVDAVLYVRVVRTLGNESLLDLSTSHRLEALYTLLPSQLVAVLIVVASTTSGVSLPADDWRVIDEACREMETLEQAREILLEYIQSRMPLIAPNLCILVGTAIASQLIGTAGSLQKLAQMPPNELMTLGSIRVTSTNFSIGVGGFLLNCDLLENQPAEVRHKALRVVANKTSLAARVDAFRYAPDGSRGIQLRALAKTTMENWFQAPDIKVSDDNTSVVPSAPKHQGSLYDRPTRVSKRTRGLVASRS